MSEPDLLELLEAEYAKEIKEATDDICRGIPEDGGHVSLKIMRAIISTAFIDGVITAQERMQFRHEKS